MTTRSIGWAVGVVGTAALTLVCVLLGDRIDETITALLLLLPIMAASALAGWKPGVVIALLSGFAYALTFLSPIGRVRLGLSRDVATIALFAVVALVVGVLAGRRRPLTADGDAADGDLVLRAVSHDLRNPLSAIRAASTDLLTTDAADATHRTELLQLVASESERLDRIVGNMLSAGRARSGALVPVLDQESPTALLRASAARLTRVVGHPVVVEAPADLPDVTVDAVQIDQVLTNLVENAARASPADAPITLRAYAAGTHVVVEVIDQGAGFAAERLDELFELYRSGTGSTGLGLAVSKAIVEAHGGSIEIVPGTAGGRVRFSVPIAPDA